MALRYHNNDFRGVPEEDGVMEAMRKFEIPPGDYVLPYAGSMEKMKSSEYIEKRDKGPVAFMTVLPSGPVSMAKSLVSWFVYSVVIGVIAAYVAGRAVGPGGEYLQVFRFTGVTAFVCYSVALWQNWIWYKRSLIATLKNTFDGLVYALLTAGVFGWLWPS
jgi:hypothetical protein